jgi:putative ABC transport system substrate-binding protein
VAHSLGLEFHVLYASTEREVEGAFASLRQLRAGGLVIDPDPFFNTRSELLGGLALPTPSRRFINISNSPQLAA